jgi:ABC-2 type transport system ATP-binding protein
LIKSLLDFISIDSGAIWIDQIPKQKAVARKALAFVPEKFRPPFFLTGRDFLKFVCRLHQVKYIEGNALSLCEQLDLDEKALTRRVSEYSKGMAQKLGLLAAFISCRPLLVLDEPMSGLDPKARIYLKNLLQQRRQQGQTLFFSSHSLADVESVCDKMVILHQGKIRFWGTPQACCQAFEKENLESAYLACIDRPI